MRRGARLRCALAAVALASAAAFGDDADLAKARDLLDRAAPFARQADDPDAENAARAEARKEARKLLRAARDAYQAWQAANGGRDDPAGQEIAKLLYWVNKMSSISEVSPGGAPAPPAPKPDVTPPGAPAAPAPAPPDPAQVARDDWARTEAFAEANRADPGAVKEAIERFLADHPDPSLPEYTKAALRLGALQDDLNATFRRVVGQDPDAVGDVDTKSTPQVVARLRRELAAKDPGARRNAARLLGMTRSGAATYALASVLRDDDAELVSVATESLVAIGGTRACENLAKQYRNGSPEAQLAAVGVLDRIAAKGPVDARTASPWIGRFALSNDGRVARRSLDALIALGEPGGPGLAQALETRIPDKKVEVIRAFAAVGYFRGAARLAVYLSRPMTAEAVQYRAAARAALVQLGRPAVPYLVRSLSDPTIRGATGDVMREVTGTKIHDDDIRGWRQWCDLYALEQKR